MGVIAKKYLSDISVYKAAASKASVVDKYHIDEDEIIKLEANENRFGCSPAVKAALSDAFAQIPAYPDLNATVLREMISQKHRVKGSNIVFGSGSFEILTMIGMAYISEGDEAISIAPTFNWYANCTKVNGGVLRYIGVDEDMHIGTGDILAAVTDRTKVVWLCNPNNPTGDIILKKDLKELIEKLPDDILVVLDEAYIDYAGDYFDTVSLISEHKNVILLRTFSKSYALASLRLGYGIADEEIIDTLAKVRCPCNLNLAALTGAEAALSDQDHFDMVIKRTEENKRFLYNAFEEFGFNYVRSYTNFIFADTGFDSASFREEILKSGIMIRAGAEFGFPTWVRITIGTDEECRLLKTAMGRAIAALNGR